MRVMEKRDSLRKYKTPALAMIWAFALAVGLFLQQLEIFLLMAPLSAGIYLLAPGRV